MNKFNFLNNEDFLKARSEGHHYFFGDCNLDLFDWNDVIPIFQDNYNKRNIIRYPNVLNNFGFTLFDASSIPIVKQFEEALETLNPQHEISGHVYVSFLKESETLGFHQDDVDVMYWQVGGSTQFTVIQNYKEYTYNLVPNEVLYVPKYLTHNTVALSPRFAVSISL
jgi:hypothetical protein